MIKIERLNDSAKLRLKFNSTKESKSILLISDVHFDSVKCNRKALKKLLDEAVERDAYIMIFGDLLDVMGAKYDPRSGKSDIRPEYNASNYFELVLNDIVNFFGPYADRILMISKGNHEDSVKRRHEFDLLSIMEYKMRMEHKWEGLIEGYEGWLLFSGEYTTSGEKNKKRKGGGRSLGTIKTYYTHGSGGNAPVTRGVIQTNRRQVQIQADMFISGHIHTQWAVPVPQRRVTDLGVEEVKDVIHLQLGCFKESHRGSWEAQKGFAASNIGGYWVKFYMDQSQRMRCVEERTMI